MDDAIDRFLVFLGVFPPKVPEVAPYSSVGHPIIGQVWALKGIGLVSIVKTGEMPGFKTGKGVAYREMQTDEKRVRGIHVLHFLDNATLLEPGEGVVH